MMNKTRLFAPRIFALCIFALIFSSCSMSGDGFSSVSVSLAPATLNQISARNGEEDGAPFALTVSLKGDYTGTQTVRITSAGTKITFSKIPEGSEIYAEASICSTNEPSEILYTGTSGKIIVSEGENHLPLVMKKVGNTSEEGNTGGKDEPIITTFTVTFVAGEGITVAPKTVKEGECTEEPEAPTKSGYAFAGWYTDATYAQEFDFSTPIRSDTTLFAKWNEESPVISFTVTFNAGEGITVAPKTVKEGECAEEPEAPTKSGYAFAGWYTDSGLSTKFNFSTPITDNITLYAKWKTPGPISLIYDSYFTTADKEEFDGYLPDKLFDNDADTKFCIKIRTNDAVIEGGLTILFHTSNPCLITKYSLTQGNDTSGFQNRAPVAWQIFGSDSINGTFELIETQNHTAEDAPLAFNTNEQPFNCTATKAYTYYKFVINRLYGTTDQYGNGLNTVQLAELKFYGDESD